MYLCRFDSRHRCLLCPFSVRPPVIEIAATCRLPCGSLSAPYSNAGQMLDNFRRLLLPERYDTAFCSADDFFKNFSYHSLTFNNRPIIITVVLQGFSSSNSEQFTSTYKFLRVKKCQHC